MILVFGKTGQVGFELDAFENVKALDRQQSDLSNPKACRNAIFFYKPTAVINAAAYTAVDNAESEECLARRINTEAPAEMAEACAELEIPFIHISTDYVFDGRGTTPYSTTDTANPQNIYGKSKLLGEKAIEASGCIFAILRTSWVVSAHGKNFVKTMLRLSKTRDRLPVVDDQIGGPTCARDIAHICVFLAQRLKEEPTKAGIYHYAGQPDVSWCQFANEIFKLAGDQTVATAIPTSHYSTPVSRPLNCRLNCSKMKEAFGISRPFWRDGLEDILKELEQTYVKA